MKISLLVDNKNSWIIPCAKKIRMDLMAMGHKVKFLNDSNKITSGDMAFFLGCEKIIKDDVLKKNLHNLVVHESSLPKGKGWSPLTWQILEGKNRIPVTLFEAVQAVDSGDIYLQKNIYFEGHELVDELRKKQGQATRELVLEFVKKYKFIKGKKQKGTSTFYSKRGINSSELDINKSIKSQFNLLRIADNERYPAFFNYKNNKYILKIFKAKYHEE